MHHVKRADECYLLTLLYRRIASVPKDKKDLYALPVDWAVLEQSSTIEKKMQPWIAKKVTEYFGETDETVISFVMEEVGRAPVSAIYTRLSV